jgi:hypothetical protein
MYILYLDESGDPHSFQSQKCYVMGGVAIHEGQIHGIGAQVDNIQSTYLPGLQIPVAFHAYDVKQGKGHFRGLVPSRRDQVMQDVYALIGSARFPYLIAFATAIDVSAVTSPTQARRSVFEDVCEKFNGFLVHQYRRGIPSKGLLIIDQNREAEYRELVNDFKTQGTTHGFLGNVVDIPYFARCHQTRMLQLADFVANAVFEYYERNDPTYLNVILPRFYGHALNRLSAGFRHIINGNCTCIACS